MHRVFLAIVCVCSWIGCNASSSPSDAESAAAAGETVDVADVTDAFGGMDGADAGEADVSGTDAEEADVSGTDAHDAAPSDTAASDTDAHDAAPNDAGTDASHDTEDASVEDTAADAPDTERDAPSDVADDAASDIARDTELDAPSDVPADTPTDAADSSMDAPPDRDSPDVALGPFVVFVAPDGSDGRDGSSPSRAVLTLTRAHEIIVAAAPERDVEVRIAPGLYLGQTVSWTYTMPEHTISFVRLDPDADRPVFDGCTVATVSDPATQCPGGTWFRLRHSSGAPSNLVFDYIRVQRYGTAISLDGNRNDADASNGSNRIYGCYFDRIGNVFNPALDPSTAALRLVNSDDNDIANNHFVDVVNTRSAGLIHAIYVAHMSDRNRILRNRFVRNSGDPIRVRDYSNDNVVNENRFIRTGIEAAYTTWYCDHDERDDCTKPEPECPSWGNQFRDNELDGNYACASLSAFRYLLDDTTTGCAPPSPEARRLRTSGNTRTDTPCSGE